MEHSWICAQLGAREHYAIPRALQQAGRLRELHSDFWAGPLIRVLAPISGLTSLRSLATRFHPDLGKGEVAAVHSWNWRSLGWEALLRRSGLNDRYSGYVEVGRRFACAVRASMRKRSGLGSNSFFFAYDTGALEAMDFLKDRGVRCVLDQMDPNQVEAELVRQEAKRWTGWQAESSEVPREYFQRREREWQLADRIVVNSEFCRRALVQQGVPAEKLVVIPLCYEEEKGEGKREKGKSSCHPLRVLFLGQVILRKGIQYLMEAARQLEGENMRFEVVGPIGISEQALKSAPKNMMFHGRVSRDQASDWYRRADVFVLPTISDGFALTQLEAMAHGLPVITTANCGDVVRHGLDGRIVPPRDAHALAEAIMTFANDRSSLSDFSQNAQRRVKDFSLRKLGNDLLEVEKALSE